MKYFLCVIGLVLILEGFPYFIFPAKMKIWLEKFCEMSETSLQKTGFVLLVAGLVLICFGTM